jgi:hypothetical protein
LDCFSFALSNLVHCPRTRVSPLHVLLQHGFLLDVFVNLTLEYQPLWYR